MRMASERDGSLGGMDDLVYREFAGSEARNRRGSRRVYTVLRSFGYCMGAARMIRANAGRLARTVIACQKSSDRIVVGRRLFPSVPRNRTDAPRLRRYCRGYLRLAGPRSAVRGARICARLGLVWMSTPSLRRTRDRYSLAGPVAQTI